MSTERARSEHRTVDTHLGPVEVLDTGEGPAVLLAHAALTNAHLWDGLAADLAPDHRVIRATLPMGAHRIPAAHRDHLGLPGLADALAEVLTALDVDRAAVAGVDTGGAVAQVLTARHPGRVAGLFLFSCDAFEHFPPRGFGPLCAAMRRTPRAAALLSVYRSAAVRRRAFWWPLAKRGAPGRLDALTFDPLWADRRILDDLVAVLASAHRSVLPGFTDQLAAYDGPAHIAWSGDDLLFPKRDAERLARTLRHAELTWIDDARSFAHLDQPEVAADRLRTFVRRCTP